MELNFERGAFMLLKQGINRLSKRRISQLKVIITLIVIYGVLNIGLSGRIFTVDNIKTVIAHSIFPAFVAWGMSFIFTGGIIDLSIGANILLSANIGATLAETYHLGYSGLIIGTLACCIIIQHLSVQCSVSLHIPSWVAGLGMALILEAILTLFATYLANNLNERLPSMKTYTALGEMPLMLIIWIIGLVAAYLLYTRSNIGLNLQAVGNNTDVASAMGINRKKTIFIAVVIGSIFIGVAAIVQISYATSMAAKSGLGSLSGIFKSLATVLLAQSFERVAPMPVGILISAIVVMSIFNVLTMLGVPTGTGQEMFLGAIVIVCGIFSHLGYKGVEK